MPGDLLWWGLSACHSGSCRLPGRLANSMIRYFEVLFCEASLGRLPVSTGLYIGGIWAIHRLLALHGLVGLDR